MKGSCIAELRGVTRQYGTAAAVDNLDLARIVMAGLFALLIVIILSVLRGTLGDVSLPVPAWLALAGVLVRRGARLAADSGSMTSGARITA